jgi:hypothetical protein
MRIGRARPAGPRSNFCAQLVKLDCAGRLIGQLIALGVVLIVFILFRVQPTALQLSCPSHRLSGAEVLRFFDRS